jgi:L-threonylcarbamoyladenylate synthase
MVEILKVHKPNFEFALEYSARLILSGKVVAFPTDTVYGLGADPFNLAAITEIFRINHR